MGKLVEIKTKQTEFSVEDFIATISDDKKRKDSEVILKMMQKAIKEKPKMWGNSMIGFGKLIIKSPATGREVEWFNIGFAPRKANLSLHFTTSASAHADLLGKLGKFKTGAGCLYINKLGDVDVKVLAELISAVIKKKSLK